MKAVLNFVRGVNSLMERRESDAETMARQFEERLIVAQQERAALAEENRVLKDTLGRIHGVIIECSRIRGGESA
jgi:hypothetical protein